MHQHAAQHAAIAGADDEHPARVAMFQQRNMAQHLLVDELVALGDLDAAIQRHDAAVAGALEHDDVLKLAAHARNFAHHAKALAPIGIQRLIKPSIGHGTLRTASGRP